MLTLGSSMSPHACLLLASASNTRRPCRQQQLHPTKYLSTVKAAIVSKWHCQDNAAQYKQMFKCATAGRSRKAGKSRTKRTTLSMALDCCWVLPSTAGGIPADNSVNPYKSPLAQQL